MAIEYLQIIVYLKHAALPGQLLSSIAKCFGGISDVGLASVFIDSRNSGSMSKSRRILKVRQRLVSTEFVPEIVCKDSLIHRMYVHIPQRRSQDVLRDFKLLIKYMISDPEPSDLAPEDNLGNSSDRGLLCPTLRISIRIDTLLADTSQARAKFVDQIVHAVAENATIQSGFVTCEPADRTCAGSLYMPPFGEELPMDLIIRELAWWRLMKTGRPMVRGVYWGNIWGSEIVEHVKRVNLLDSIAGWKVEHLTKGTMVPGGASVEPLADGSVFVKLSPDPLDCSETWREHGGKKFIGLFDSLANIQTSFAAWIHVQLRLLDLLL